MIREFDAAVGLALRSLRAEKGMTVLDLVEETGIPGSDIEAYEAGAPIPTPRLRAMSGAFGLDVLRFMGRVYPHSTGESISTPTPEEGWELVGHFRQIPAARSRRFLIDMAHALADYDFRPE